MYIATIIQISFLSFFSSCGDYLATQGEIPDHLITIWDWKNESKIASKPSPANQHFQITFAYGQHNKITTCGKFSTKK